MGDSCTPEDLLAHVDSRDVAAALAELRRIEGMQVTLPSVLIKMKAQIFPNPLESQQLDDLSRDLLIQQLVQAFFDLIDPKEEYTRATDFVHGFKVRQWIVDHLQPRPVPVVLSAAALMHDSERWPPWVRTNKLNDPVLDELIRKPVLHPTASMAVARALYVDTCLSAFELQQVEYLILHHEQFSNDPVVLRGEVILEAPDAVPELFPMLKVLREADTMAFFLFCIPIFIDHFLSKGIAPSKIQRRIRSMYNRVDSIDMRNSIECRMLAKDNRLKCPVVSQYFAEATGRTLSADESIRPIEDPRR